MNNISNDGLMGIAVIAIMMIIMIILSLPKNITKKIILRDIEALDRLRKNISSSIEKGKHIHIALGHANILSPNNASSFIGLNILNKIEKIAVRSDAPPIATSGDGTLTILSQDTIKSACHDLKANKLYKPYHAFQSGSSPNAYVLGSLPLLQNDKISPNNMIGYWGPESGILSASKIDNQAYILAASESLPTQAVMLGTADDILIGEEVFSMPAYINSKGIDVASVKAQDIIRWIIILFISASILIKLIKGFIG